MTGILNTTSLSRAAAAALSALLLSGCAALSGGGSEAIPADAMKRPVDLSVVCVLVNEDVKSEPLVKSLETGVRSFGSEPRLLMPGDGPQACSFVVTYEVRTNARAIEAVRFQTFENSVPALEASGRANPGSGPHGRQRGRLHGPASQSDEEEAWRQGRSARRTRARSDSGSRRPAALNGTTTSPPLQVRSCGLFF